MKTIKLHINRLEQGNHIFKKIIDYDVLPVKNIIVLEHEISEIRPDYGQYLPIITFAAVDRYLRSNGFMPKLTQDLIYSYHIE